MSAQLELDGVTMRHRDREVLTRLSFAVEQGEVVALLGPSGSGKTSIIRLLLGLAMPDEGSVRIAGETASSGGRSLIPPEKRGLAVVFQDLALWPHLSVKGNLSFGLDATKVPLEEKQRRIREILDRVGLAGKEDRKPGELSGGERQRVAIARALVLKPRAVLLDEPLSNLDVTLKRELLALFRELLGGGKVTALIVTHNLREAAAIANRALVVELGRLTQSGSLDELRATPASGFVKDLIADAGDAPVAALSRRARQDLT